MQVAIWDEQSLEVAEYYSEVSMHDASNPAELIYMINVEILDDIGGEDTEYMHKLFRRWKAQQIGNYTIGAGVFTGNSDRAVTLVGPGAVRVLDSIYEELREAVEEDTTEALFNVVVRAIIALGIHGG